MKKSLCVLLSLLFLLPLTLVSHAADGELVIASADARPVIVLPDAPTAPVRNAAQVLTRYLRQITGCADTAPRAECRIVLDDGSVQPPSDKDGAYRRHE